MFNLFNIGFMNKDFICIERIYFYKFLSSLKINYVNECKEIMNDGPKTNNFNISLYNLSIKQSTQ